jgi:hypothetical protein
MRIEPGMKGSHSNPDGVERSGAKRDAVSWGDENAEVPGIIISRHAEQNDKNTGKKQKTGQRSQDQSETQHNTTKQCCEYPRRGTCARTTRSHLTKSSVSLIFRAALGVCDSAAR